ncbi:TF26 [Hepatospora eriocheir]|uniref:RNA-directed DNA polymerase n=1 Tax=Hepatospora eriocheir TaxID=1081669 RepID=A0A1X0QKS2_9MICR|nr:TF26 [Hepatospora eriocheir]
MCEINERDSLKHLYLLVDEKYHGLLNGKRKIETALNSLISESYNKEKFNELYEELKNLKVGRRSNIKEYYEKFSGILQIADLCVSPKERFNDRELSELFYSGIPKWMQYECIRLGNMSLRDKVRILYQLEVKHQEDYQKERKGNKFNDVNKNQLHNTTETRNKKDGRNYNEEKKMEKMGVIAEVDKGPDEIMLNCEVKEIGQCEALLDTGAKQNFINEEILQRSKLLRKTNQMLIKVANGEKVMLNEEVELLVKFDQLPGVEYKINAIIFPKLTHDLILGMQFIQQNNVAIDLSTGILRMDNKYVEIQGVKEDSVSEPENMVVDNLRVIQDDERIEMVLKPFKLQNPEFGLLRGFKHEIKLTDEIPVQGKAYGVPQSLLSGLQEEIEELLKHGIIRKSNSYYGLPSFVIQKKNGKVRLVTNFIELNDKTIPEVYPFPDMNDKIINLRNAKWFSQVDLDRGFYQIELKEEDKHKTGFLLPIGHFEYYRLPMGLINSPKAFQRVMDELIGHLEYCEVFVDDILIFSNSFEEHLIHIREVCKIILNRGGKINFEKSKFGSTTVTYLGNIIDSEGIKPIVDKMIEYEHKVIKTKRGLRKFLGVANWYRKYVMNLSELTNKLNEKLKIKDDFKWTKEDEEMKNKIIEATRKYEKLMHINPNEEFFLETDASERGIGGVLRQAHGIVGIYSRKLQGSELNYSIPEKELYAVIKSMNHFRKLIWGRRLTVLTDSKDVASIKGMNESRLKRWLSLMGEYEYCIKHIDGNENCLADAISRGEIRVVETLRIQSEKKLKQDENGKIIIDEENIEQFVRDIHVCLLHSGISRMYQTLKRYYSIKNIKEVIERVCSECKECKLNKNRRVYHETGKGRLHCDEINRNVSSDIIGPFLREVRGRVVNYYGITFTDLCSRYCKVYFTRRIRGEELVNAFKSKWIEDVGIPKLFYSDQGRQYTSEEFQRYLKDLNIKQRFNTAYNPQGNGISERFNQEIGLGLRMYGHLCLDEIEAAIEYGHNNSYCRSIGACPMEIMKEMNEIDMKRRRIKIDLKEVNRIAKEGNNLNKDDEQVGPENRFDVQIGDEIYIKTTVRGKTDPYQEGPFKVIEISKGKNALFIDFRRKREWVNLRRLVIFKDRGNCRILQNE